MHSEIVPRRAQKQSGLTPNLIWGFAMSERLKLTYIVLYQAKLFQEIEFTVNRKYFVVKLFPDSLACAKIKRTKIYAQYER